MIYVMSDLHGCYDKYEKMLEKIDFSSDDSLYVLGDIIDRGEEGIKILLDIMGKKNIFPIMGNHEQMALNILQGIIYEQEFVNSSLSPISSRLYDVWMANGGFATYSNFMLLHANQQMLLLEFIESFPLNVELIVNAKKYYLAHSALNQSVREKKPGFAIGSDRIWERVDYNRRYFADGYFISGHTPTFIIGSTWRGKIYKKHGHIAIDCGAVYGEKLGCICLDNLKEYYV